MKAKLHLVFGGELLNPQSRRFKDPANVEVIGLFPNYQIAYDAWKEASQMNVDNANYRYYIAKLYQLMDEEKSESPIEEFTS